MNPSTRQYIVAHRSEDVRLLALKGSKDKDVDMALALRQIAGWQTACVKLPSWASVEGLLYPPHLSMEQCSGEAAARYKSDVVKSLIAAGAIGQDSFVDLTGGFGVDFFFISEWFRGSDYVEQDEQLCHISSSNFALLGRHANVVCDDATAYIRRMDRHSLAFIDPSRRDIHGCRTYSLADCTPNVLELRHDLLAKTDLTLMKLSPMLDWRKAVNDVGRANVRRVHIVSVGGECKELLIEMQSRPLSTGVYNTETSLSVVCVNILPDGHAERFVYTPSGRDAAHVVSPCISDYLYEPNASIMKAGCFQEISAAYGLQPISPNSHLLSGSTLQATFPGRRFHISAISSMNRRELKTALAGVTKANITTRNFPLAASELRRRLKLSDGGDTYIFATTDACGAHVLLVCTKC